jgi:biopolymer transport protein ExbB
MSIINFEIISKGGPTMVVLLICSIFSLAMILERLLALRHTKIFKLDLLHEIEIDIKKRDIASAIEWCEQYTSPMMAVVKVALINSDKPKEDLKIAIEEAGRLEVPHLERFLTSIHTIAVISPLLGLLGTVLGMINVFKAIVAHGTGNTEVLAGGIAEALITTATGMTIAIPTLIAYNLLARKVDLLLVQMERYSLIIFELLTNDYSEF